MWRVLGASAIGTSHFRQGTPCQDAHGTAQVSPEVLIAAVADGLGSAPNSAEGARLAITESLRLVVEKAATHAPESDDEWRDLFERAFLAARSSLEAASGAQNLPVESFDTTLILAVAMPSRIVVGHVGDGAVIGWIEDHQILTISSPERHEFLNFVTPITVTDLRRAIRHSVFNGRVHGICLMTDGLQSLAMNLDSGVAYGGFFRPLFTQLHDAEDVPNEDGLQEFLGSNDINSRTTDDKTLLWATWQEPST